MRLSRPRLLPRRPRPSNRYLRISTLFVALRATRPGERAEVHSNLSTLNQVYRCRLTKLGFIIVSNWLDVGTTEAGTRNIVYVPVGSHFRQSGTIRCPRIEQHLAGFGESGEYQPDVLHLIVHCEEDALEGS
jgi:hypothetical protein